MDDHISKILNDCNALRFKRNKKNILWTIEKGYICVVILLLIVVHLQFSLYDWKEHFAQMCECVAGSSIERVVAHVAGSSSSYSFYYIYKIKFVNIFTKCSHILYFS